MVQAHPDHDADADGDEHQSERLRGKRCSAGHGLEEHGHQHAADQDGGHVEGPGTSQSGHPGGDVGGQQQTR